MTLARKLREQLGLTLTDVAKLSGYTREYICEMESGGHSAPSAFLGQLASVLCWSGEPYALLGKVGCDEL